jgi:hypothetical protein
MQLLPQLPACLFGFIRPNGKVFPLPRAFLPQIQLLEIRFVPFIAANPTNMINLYHNLTVWTGSLH